MKKNFINNNSFLLILSLHVERKKNKHQYKVRLLSLYKK
jgi:hypothetical protein